MNHKWKLIKRRYLYRAKTPDEVSFLRDKVELPSGKKIDYVYVDCPYEVVYVIGIDNKKRVCLIRQYRYILNQDILEIPAGSPNLGETLEEGALREFEEETGFRPSELVKLGSFYPAVGVMNQFSHIYLARKLRKTTQKLEETETIRVQWVSIEKAIGFVRQGKIINMGSAYGLFLADLWLKNN